MKVFVIGVGLIGGSLATDIKVAYNNAVVYGVDANDDNLEIAIKLGFIDKKATFADLNIADLVIVAVPVDIARVVLPQVLDLVTKDCVVFDVGSTKEMLCAQVVNHSNRKVYFLVLVSKLAH